MTISSGDRVVLLSAVDGTGVAKVERTTTNAARCIIAKTADGILTPVNFYRMAGSNEVGILATTADGILTPVTTSPDLTAEIETPYIYQSRRFYGADIESGDTAQAYADSQSNAYSNMLNDTSLGDYGTTLKSATWDYYGDCSSSSAITRYTFNIPSAWSNLKKAYLLINGYHGLIVENWVGFSYNVGTYVNTGNIYFDLTNSNFTSGQNAISNFTDSYTVSLSDVNLSYYNNEAYYYKPIDKTLFSDYAGSSVKIWIKTDYTNFTKLSGYEGEAIRISLSIKGEY